MDWLNTLSNNFLAESRPGWLVVDAEHENCYTEPGRVFRWFAVVHRETMGRLECPECGKLDGCTVRVWSTNDSKKVRKHWANLEPIVHNSDGTIKEDA